MRNAKKWLAWVIGLVLMLVSICPVAADELPAATLGAEETVTEPEETSAEHEGTRAEPDTAVTELETTEAEAEESSAEPETTETEPEETTVAEPEEASTESETTVIEPETTVTEAESEETSVEPETTETEPEETSAEPETTETEPEETSAEPETTVADPEETSTEPEETSTEPETMETEPEETSTEPETMETEPEETSVEPETTETEPEETSAEPETTEAKPEETNEEPEVTATEPETTVPEPESTVIEFVTTVTEPEETSVEPGVVATDSENVTAEPETESETETGEGGAAGVIPNISNELYDLLLKATPEELERLERFILGGLDAMDELGIEGWDRVRLWVECNMTTVLIVAFAIALLVWGALSYAEKRGFRKVARVLNENAMELERKAIKESERAEQSYREARQACENSALAVRASAEKTVEVIETTKRELVDERTMLVREVTRYTDAMGGMCEVINFLIQESDLPQMKREEANAIYQKAKEALVCHDEQGEDE